MSDTIKYTTYEASLERSRKLEEDLILHPEKYKVLTGDMLMTRFHKTQNSL